MSLNENVFNTGKKLLCYENRFLHEKKRLPSTSKIPSTTKSLLLGRKTNVIVAPALPSAVVALKKSHHFLSTFKC